MSIPIHLQSSFSYVYMSAVTDVSSIISQFSSTALAQNPAWTNPSGYEFVSPVDAAGRSFTLYFTRIVAAQLQIQVVDQYGNTIDTRQIWLNSSGPGNDVSLYIGQYHVWIESWRTTPETFRAGILDLTPQAQNRWRTPVYVGGYRDSSGDSLSSDAAYLAVYGVSNGGTNSNNIIFVVQTLNTDGTLQAPSGDMAFFPVFLVDPNNNFRLLGRMYQVLIGPAGAISIGAAITIPIDLGVTGTFMPSGSALGGQMANYRFLIRSA